MQMTTLDQINNTYALIKHEDGFLSFKKPTRYIRVTSHFIIDELNHSTTSFSKDSLYQLLEESWHIQLLNYELGILFELDKIFSIDEKEIELATLINFSEVEKKFPVEMEQARTQVKPIEILSFESYQEKFKQTYENLLDGNCYQLNLTSNLKFKVDDVSILEKTFETSKTFKSLSEFAHLINLGATEQLIISNSPECLFEYDEQAHKLTTRPIKGTVRKELGIEALRNDVKNESELNIITDLLRNDFSRIGESYAKVEAMREFFEVPGLIHQNSRISVKCKEFSSARILKAVFPGGSITGAPKKRVMQIISEIENETRGVYTGSTLICLKDIKKASINIRTLVIDRVSGVATYGSGGGITLLSEEHSEFAELLDKTYSFLKVFFKDVKI